MPSTDLATAWIYNPTIIEDLRFLDAWERGCMPTLSGFLRARQIRRANLVGFSRDGQNTANGLPQSTLRGTRGDQGSAVSD